MPCPIHLISPAKAEGPFVTWDAAATPLLRSVPDVQTHDGDFRAGSGDIWSIGVAPPCAVMSHTPS
jgi:hypothetical protein